MGCGPWGREELDTTEQLPFHFSLLCIGEGNGNPLQCSCLENPRDGGAWWAAISGVTQSWTRLKRLSSSSSSRQKRKGYNQKQETNKWENSLVKSDSKDRNSSTYKYDIKTSNQEKRRVQTQDIGNRLEIKRRET